VPAGGVRPTAGGLAPAGALGPGIRNWNAWIPACAGRTGWGPDAHRAEAEPPRCLALRKPADQPQTGMFRATPRPPAVAVTPQIGNITGSAKPEKSRSPGACGDNVTTLRHHRPARRRSGGARRPHCPRCPFPDYSRFKPRSIRPQPRMATRPSAIPAKAGTRSSAARICEKGPRRARLRRGVPQQGGPRPSPGRGGRRRSGRRGI
jgi:hypothetical protein